MVAKGILVVGGQREPIVAPTQDHKAAIGLQSGDDFTNQVPHDLLQTAGGMEHGGDPQKQVEVVAVILHARSFAARLRPPVAARTPASGKSHSDGEMGPMRRSRTGTLSQLLYRITMAVLRVGLLPYWPAQVEGLEQLPQQGPALLAGNHATILDPFLLSPHLPRRIDFIMAPKARTIPLVGRWFYEMGAIPRGPGCVPEALDRLSQGMWIGIYPEGGHTYRAELAPMHLGVYQLARDSRAPVVPVATVGAHLLMPERAPYVAGGPVLIRFGQPLFVEPNESSERFMARLREVLEQLLQASPKAWTPSWGFRLRQLFWTPTTWLLFRLLDHLKPGHIR